MRTLNPLPRIRLQRSKPRSAFSLVEVTMAMGLMTFCLVAMLGVLPVGLAQERLSSEKLVAMQVLAAVENDFRFSSSSRSATPRYGIPTTVGASGTFFVGPSYELIPVEADSDYRVAYRVNGPSGTDQALRMHVFVGRTRPGEATPQNAAEGIVQQQLQ